MKPTGTPKPGCKDPLSLWLRQDLNKQFSRIETAPMELVALIDAHYAAQPAPCVGGRNAGESL